MKEYVIKCVNGQPDWTAVPCLSMEETYLQTPVGISAHGQICCNEDALLVHLWADVPEIRAVETGPLGSPCEDSCLEFFFQPVSGDARYINLEFNFNGCFYLGIGNGIGNLIRMVPDSKLFCPDIRATETGWEIFYRIPYSFIRVLFPNFEVTPGAAMRANCYACSDLTVPHYYLSWNPVDTEHFSFHQPKCFGNMKFENN